MPLELENGLQVPRLVSVVQETVIAYFLESRRKHMHEEAPDEFLNAQHDKASWVSCFHAPGRKSDRCFGNFYDPAVGNGNFMRVAAQVLNGIAEAVEGLLDEGAPVLLVKVPDSMYGAPG